MVPVRMVASSTSRAGSVSRRNNWSAASERKGSPAADRRDSGWRGRGGHVAHEWLIMGVVIEIRIDTDRDPRFTA